MTVDGFMLPQSQMEDPLVVCANLVPRWVHWLAINAPFLLSPESRYASLSLLFGSAGFMSFLAPLRLIPACISHLLAPIVRLPPCSERVLCVCLSRAWK